MFLFQLKMYQFSDSESKDSEDGIRFKTDSTRNKNSNVSSSSSQKNSERNRNAENSPRRRRRHSRSRSLDRRRRHRSRERSHRDKESSKRSESLSLSDEEVDRKKHPLKRKSSKHHRRRRSRSGSRRRESRHRDGRRVESEGRLKDDNKNKNFQEASDDRGDPPSVLGPALPPHLKKDISENDNTQEKPANSLKETNENNIKQTKTEFTVIGPNLPTRSPEMQKVETSCIGPVLPPHLQENIGPALPPDFQEKSQQNDDTTETIGPTLPSYLQEQTCENPKTIGPTLPSHLRKKLEEEADEQNRDEEVYGPLPPGMSAHSAAHVALEERALQMKLSALDPVKEKAEVREEWMLELPDVKAAHLGLGPRQFRGRAGPDLTDRYGWVKLAMS